MFPGLKETPVTKLEFSEVLLSSADGKFAAGKDVKSVVKAEILGHVQGDKVISFKMKRRKGFRKKHGHRTHYTKIKVTDIAIKNWIQGFPIFKFSNFQISHHGT